MKSELVELLGNFKASHFAGNLLLLFVLLSVGLDNHGSRGHHKLRFLEFILGRAEFLREVLLEVAIVIVIIQEQVLVVEQCTGPGIIIDQQELMVAVFLLLIRQQDLISRVERTDINLGHLGTDSEGVSVEGRRLARAMMLLTAAHGNDVQEA